jgi:hypothetical protein
MFIRIGISHCSNLAAKEMVYVVPWQFEAD